MKAVIMAGGEGTRLRPLTCSRPKPMVPVANKPVMQHILELLKKYEIKDIAVTLQYLPDDIMDFFGDGKEFDANLNYFVEKIPLGTAGSVKNAEKFLNETFVVISGDALTDINLAKAIKFHKETKSIATLILKKVDIPLEYGVVVTDNEGKIIRFLEKPSWGEVFSDTVNTGIYILSPEIFEFYKPNEMFDFSKDLFPMLLKEKKPMYGFVTDDYWCDIGDLRAYLQAHTDILDGRVDINIPGSNTGKNIWVDKDAEIEDGAVLKGSCIIGPGTRIKKGAVIGEYSVIGSNNIIEEMCGVKRSIIWRNCTLDRNVQLRGSVICNKVHLKENVSAFEESVIGDETVVKEGAIIKPSIKIWPDKLIERATEVNSNLVWGSKFTRSIFGSRGVAGEINVDITPEYASKLAAAYGSICKSGSRICISSDDAGSSHMIKMSFISGLLSAGHEVWEMGKMPLPAARSAVRFYRLDGGIHISTSSENRGRLSIDFLNKNGCNIERDVERKIENAFIREDFSRCEGVCIKPVKEIKGYCDFYLKAIANSISNRDLGYNIGLHSKSNFILDIMTKVLEDIGCKAKVVDLKLYNTKTGKESMTSGDVKFFSSHIKIARLDLGVSIEETSEKMLLVDNKGRLITEDMFIALVSIILFKTIQGGTVVAPISASRVLEKIALEHNGKIVRSKTSAQDFMGRLLGGGLREELLEQFTMHFDAAAGLVKILNFMKTNNYTLSDLVDMIPDFHIDKKEVECGWSHKGKVIRQIMQESDADRIETLEGVKVYRDGGWVLVLPDPEKPICRVISESSSAEFASELSSIYVNKIRQISRS